MRNLHVSQTVSDTGLVGLLFIVFQVYYESIKREPKIRGIYECRCDERLQTKTKEFTRLPYTGLVIICFLYWSFRFLKKKGKISGSLHNAFEICSFDVMR
jgi:hypothetical protein